MDNMNARLTWYLDALGLAALAVSASLLVGALLATGSALTGMLFQLFFPTFATAILCMLGARAVAIADVLRSNETQTSEQTNTAANVH